MPDLGQSGATDRERELHAIEGDGGLLDAACEVKPAYDDDDGDWEWLWLYYLGEAAASAIGKYGLLAAGGALLLAAVGYFVVRRIEKRVVEDE